MKTAQEWTDSLLSFNGGKEPITLLKTQAENFVANVQADAQAELKAELTRWQNAFAMFKGTPEELAQWAIKDAKDCISQAQIATLENETGHYQ